MGKLQQPHPRRTISSLVKAIGCQQVLSKSEGLGHLSHLYGHLGWLHPEFITTSAVSIATVYVTVHITELRTVACGNSYVTIRDSIVQLPFSSSSSSMFFSFLF